MRNTVQIEKKEQNAIKRVFFLYGSKATFERTTGKSRDALSDLIEKGRATEETVNAARWFVKSWEAYRVFLRDTENPIDFIAWLAENELQFESPENKVA
jgi:hypothetical protein